jgi:gliding motility-associated-like protein
MLIVALLGYLVTSRAQRPVILSVEPTKASAEKVVTINGSQFGITPAAITVRFGAAKADIKLIQDHLLQVRVPAGATFDNISVTKTAAGLSAYSREQFTLAFQGKPGFDVADLDGQLNFPSTAPTMDGLFDMCMCDFDGDKRNDIAVTNENSPYIMLYPNSSTGPGVISFGIKYAFNTFTRTLHIRCGDVNGDGKPEIVATDGGTTGDKVFILRNTSTGSGSFSFVSQSISLSGAKLKQIELSDLDLDGKPEVIATTQSSNTVRILPNISTSAAVVFAAPVSIPLTGVTNTDGLAVEDINGDFIPEILTAQYQTNSNIYIIRNSSTPGVLNLELSNTTIPVGGYIKTIRIADLNRDGKNDVFFTQQLPTPQVGAVLNQSSGSFSFGVPQYFATDGVPYGMDFGDLDGDGLADIVVASATKKSLTIFNNTSNGGALNFSPTIKTGLTYLSRHVRIGDLDTDGKPDIAFTSIDDATLVVAGSKVSVFRNKKCIDPELTPPGPLNICNTFPQQLEATYGAGLTYSWVNHTTNVTTPGTHLFTPSVSGEYTVIATGEGGTCTEESNAVNITISPGTAADPLPKYNEPVCVGATLSFSLDNDLGVGYVYNWTGPDGYSATGQNPTRTNARLTDAGEYFLEVLAPGGCIAHKQSLLVKISDRPNFSISYPNSEILCSGQFKKLTVEPASVDYTYQWFETTSGALGITATSYDIAAGGEYYVRATSITGCGIIESSKATIKMLAIPVPAFNLQASACKGQEITFTDQSTVDSQEPAFYSWSFGDGNTSDQKNATHIYSTTGSKTVTLTVSYKNNSCSRVSTPPKQITITDAPSISITSTSGIYSICPEGEMTLTVAGSFNSYAWSTGASTSSIEITQPGTYTVDVVATNGCELKAVRDIEQFPAPVVQITANPGKVEEGESSQLFAEGLLNYSWTPTETLDNSNIQGPTATPLSNTTYTVTGFDANGCMGEASIEVKVEGDAIVDKLLPSNFFSPNSDAENPRWVVGEISEFPQCGVTVYDDKGVKVFDAKPYLDNWDGTHNGKPLPDGVYYYIIRCDGEESKPRMGSITILR